MEAFMKRLNLIGETFGRLKVLEYANNRIGIKGGKRRGRWLCECECGNKVEVASEKLRSGWTQSCGCLQKEIARNRFWNGVGLLSGARFGRIKHIARYRNLEMNVTKEYLWELYLKQQGKCALSDLPIPMDIASLDRIDSSKGYIEGNVQWLHKDINIMKWNHNLDYFIEMCKHVIKTAKRNGALSR
jgi:hypothetical protein